MEFDILTLFPDLFKSVFAETVLSRALEQKRIRVHFHQIRDYTTDKHRTVDDLPYGGGPGMVMKCEPLALAWQAAKARNPEVPTTTILFSPQGAPLAQRQLAAWAKNGAERRFILVCGRYEGVDERFISKYVDQEVSLGDFILTGGEIPAMAFIDGISRLLPGVLGNEQSAEGETFSDSVDGGLEYPQFTRPPEFEGMTVPDVLLSGHHVRIAEWRKQQSRARTRERRPDLLSTKKE